MKKGRQSKGQRAKYRYLHIFFSESPLIIVNDYFIFIDDEFERREDTLIVSVVIGILN